MTDFLHPVLTPATLLMGECLALSQIVTPRDVAAALFTCNVFLTVHLTWRDVSSHADHLSFFQYVHGTKRVVPEALVLLRRLLASASSSKKALPESWLALDNVKAAAKLSVAPLTASALSEAAAWSDDFRCVTLFLWNLCFELNSLLSRLSALRTTIAVIKSYATLYTKNDSFTELLGVFVPVLDDLLTDTFPTEIHTALKSLREQIATAAKDLLASRQPLRLQEKKIVGLKMHNPRFDGAGRLPIDRKLHDIDRDRSELKKLQHLQRRETKVRRLVFSSASLM